MSTSGYDRFPDNPKEDEEDSSHPGLTRRHHVGGNGNGSGGGSGGGSSGAAGGTPASASADTAQAGGDSTADGDAANTFECHICLETATEPCITQCGHLFCWPCLYKWMTSGRNECPVCKAGVTQENVIPLYGRGKRRDPANQTVPERPRGHRPEAPPQANPQNMFGAQFTAGIGFFPSLFGLQFQAFPSPMADANATPEERQQAFLSKLLVALGMFVIFSLLFM